MQDKHRRVIRQTNRDRNIARWQTVLVANQERLQHGKNLDQIAFKRTSIVEIAHLKLNIKICLHRAKADKLTGCWVEAVLTKILRRCPDTRHALLIIGGLNLFTKVGSRLRIPIPLASSNEG